MTIQTIIRLVKYFSLLTFVLSSVFIALVYFSPKYTIVDYSVLYGVAFGGLTIILLGIVVCKMLFQQNNRRKLLYASGLLVANLMVAIVYYFIWEYALGTILVKITNNTGQDVKEAGIYGCFHQNWGVLKHGESKTVRFPGDVSCMFIVTYKLNGTIRHEALPRKYLTLNMYKLGTHPNMEVEE